LRAIREADHDSVFGLHTQSEKGVAEAIGFFSKLSIGDSFLFAVYGGFIRATFREVTVKKEGSQIKILRHNGR
jgi:hypothetical protein